MSDSLLPQNPFDGQVYIDYARQTRWVYSKAYELWERQGIAEPPAPASETTVGTLDKLDKAFIDTIQTGTPGSFAIIVDPKSGLTGVDGDNLISGNIKLVSDSLDIKCTVFTPLGKQPEETIDVCEPGQASFVPDGPQPPSLIFSLSTNFLNSLAIDIPGPRGDRGPKGLQGLPGKHGFDFLGPPGEIGKNGVNGTTAYTLEGILYEDFPNELSDTSVVDLALETLDAGGKKINYTKSSMDLVNDAANRVAVSLLSRYIEYPTPTSECNSIALNSWQLRQPLSDNTKLDLNLLRLPTGSDDSNISPVQFDSSFSLTNLIEAVVDKYQASLDRIDKELGARAKAYIEDLDSQARQILADLASKLSSSEFSLPAQDYCLTFASCNTPKEFPTTPTPIAPTPVPAVPSPAQPPLPPPYTPSPTIPNLPPVPTVTPTAPPAVLPPLQPPLPPVVPPGFPPVPTPSPTSQPPTVAPPPTPKNPPPTPFTWDPPPLPPTPTSPSNLKPQPGQMATMPTPQQTLAQSVVTLNNRNWFYIK